LWISKRIQNETFCATQDCMNNKKAENNFKAFSIQKEPIGEILYFGDPMCSWCWGITNDLEMLKEHFKQELQFELILGGLRPGGGDKWDKKMKKMLKGHWGMLMIVQVNLLIMSYLIGETLIMILNRLQEQ
jgi:hypothetical protein